MDFVASVQSHIKNVLRLPVIVTYVTHDVVHISTLGVVYQMTRIAWKEITHETIPSSSPIETFRATFNRSAHTNSEEKSSEGPCLTLTSILVAEMAPRAAAADADA
ncbi:hypothetical protein BKA82DRAFT_22313 [Pisolithus tinctorius]|uniref:Uncharacterized protein n=1 Tax=Pisolithus tinctorius Marx 270 TaxID=870435 RepID=A0A0C3JJ24_PISTI|nr:hypothetical protein BKA82DRAFT_22313 [Pisolithus tinctorius]KIO09108.1 hypothetical protein M404DRAFT_22313 [Pisolithus tinctorius Marx 270]